jgi:NAD(P)-dependent dehydrogenase (short-subunit alcohol dehydrogenase family)
VAKEALGRLDILVNNAGAIKGEITKALSDPAVKSNVLITGVSPGPVKTERWDRLMAPQAQAAGQDVADYVKERRRRHPRSVSLSKFCCVQ